MLKMSHADAYHLEASSGGHYAICSIKEDLSDLKVVGLVMDEDGEACHYVMIEVD